MGWREALPGGARGRRLAIAILLLAFATLVVAAPWLPSGIDLYAHLLWAQQVMRCLASGQLPVWLPDLDAGFGSPGIRLYSPLGPVVDGVLGLVLGGAGRGLRAGLVLSLVALALLIRYRRRRQWQAEWLLVAFSPMVIYDVWGRSAWSEVLAIPALWWLLDTAVRGRPRPLREGAVIGALWLLHAPTTLMAAVLVAIVAVAGRDLRALVRWVEAAGFAAACTAWQWLPLLNELRGVGSRAALTEGIYRTAGNVIGSSMPHGFGHTVALGWIGVGLLAASLAGRWWRKDAPRVILMLVCIFLASWLARALWRAPGPQEWLQFPWRFLVPATLLAAAPLARGIDGWRGRVAAVLFLAPLAVCPLARPVGDVGLKADSGWLGTGKTISRMIGGNPFLVDVPEHRLLTPDELAAALERFGPERLALLSTSDREPTVTRWQPLRREVLVESAVPTRLTLRLTGYPWWIAEVDGKPAAVVGHLVTVAVPAGRHLVVVRWGGNSWSRVGLAIAGAAFLAAAVAWRRRADSVVEETRES